MKSMCLYTIIEECDYSYMGSSFIDKNAKCLAMSEFEAKKICKKLNEESDPNKQRYYYKEIPILSADVKVEIKDFLKSKKTFKSIFKLFKDVFPSISFLFAVIMLFLTNIAAAFVSIYFSWKFAIFPLNILFTILSVSIFGTSFFLTLNKILSRIDIFCISPCYSVKFVDEN